MRKEDGDGLTVCREFRRRYPERFRLLIQPGKGKSEALNLGIAEARGELLAMTDDDVLCAPDYVAGIQSVFERYPADAAQGRIFLDCEGDMPEWMSARHSVFMSSCDYGDQVQQPFDHTLFGTNMVVRAEAARAVGGFVPELGPGSAVGFAEDTEFSIRLRDAGYRLIYAPQIVVRHQLPRRRLTRSFFRKRYFGLGRSHAYYDPPFKVPRWRWGGYVVKNWIEREAQALRLRITGRPAEALDCQCEAREQAGFFFQHCCFLLGVPRRLSRVACWSEQTPAVDFQPLKDEDPRYGRQTTRG
jgi:glycosyltransferase involved in cell wall biosynthesis